MKNFRFSLASMLSMVGAIAAACAALVRPTSAWEFLVSVVASACLAYALPAACYARGAERSFWIWFAAIGWGYLIAAHFGATAPWPTTRISEELQGLLQPEAWEVNPDGDSFLANEAEILQFEAIALWLWSLLLGWTLGMVARRLHARRERLAARVCSGSRQAV